MAAEAKGNIFVCHKARPGARKKSPQPLKVLRGTLLAMLGLCCGGLFLRAMIVTHSLSVA